MRYFNKLSWVIAVSGMFLLLSPVAWAVKPPTITCADINFIQVDPSNITLIAGSTDERGKIEVNAAARSCTVTFGRFSGEVVCVALSDATALAGNQVSDNAFAFVTSAVEGVSFSSMTYMCSEL